MSNQRFEKLTNTLQNVLATEVMYKKVSKLNMTTADAFLCGSGNVKTTIYFDPEWDDDVIVHRVARIWREQDPNVADLESIFVSRLNDRDYVLEHVERSVIGTKLNEEMLERCVNRKYLDLSVIYKVIVGRSSGGRATTTVTKELAEALNLTLEDLETASMKNQGVDDFVTASVHKILVESGQIPEELTEFADDEFYPMYVISTKDGMNGAASILHTSLFAGLADTLKSDLYILPSSIFELICVPDQGQPAGFFREMVAAVNHDVVAANEVLCNSVYKYKRKTGVISIAE